jgi:NAD(P)-dependent dehydrogenase (short-subunit alcohol dehydrogenase family)
MAQKTDPRDEGLKPPFPKQSQRHPGSDAKLRPKADHGEETYVGHARLLDRVALITGGDSGIGRAIAIAFAREGADVAISYVGNGETEDAATTIEWIERAERRASRHVVDLAFPDQCEKLVHDVVKEHGRIDLLVLNAAYQGKSVERFEDFDAPRVQRTFAVNIESMFHVTRAALPHMKEGAVILTTSSIQAFEPSPNILEYACTKAAVHNFTKGLAEEMLERGIRVNCVAPGPVWTPLIAQSFDPKEVSEFGRSSPMKRPAQPAELAPAYVFLASDEARYITGEILGVTGGKRLS